MGLLYHPIWVWEKYQSLVWKALIIYNEQNLNQVIKANSSTNMKETHYWINLQVLNWQQYEYECLRKTFFIVVSMHQLANIDSVLVVRFRIFFR